MGKAIGQNAEQPEAFLRKHAKEPVLPQRECQRRPAATTPHNITIFMSQLGMLFGINHRVNFAELPCQAGQQVLTLQWCYTIGFLQARCFTDKGQKA